MLLDKALAVASFTTVWFLKSEFYRNYSYETTKALLSRKTKWFKLIPFLSL